tara:strand:- start:161 stop:796 length:636 start_codon:yes stop_codon:yes gene_type:complete
MSTVFFFKPSTEGYAETYIMKRNIFRSDTGALFSHNHMDAYANLSEYPKMKVSAEYKLVGRKDVDIAQSLVMAGLSGEIYMPLWLNSFRVSSTWSGTTLIVKATDYIQGGPADLVESPFSNYLHSGGAGHVRANTAIFALDQEDKYTHEIFTDISSTNGSTQFNLGSSPSATWAVDDYIIPAIKCSIASKEITYSTTHAFTMYVSLEMVEI